MIDLYYLQTPGGHKIPIMLEETGLEYRVNAGNMRRGVALLASDPQARSRARAGRGI
jgi:glutathione S-transferase